MKDRTLEKIIKFFNEIERPIKIGLKKITKNNSVNKHITEYAVIYGGEDIMFSNRINKKDEFQEKNWIDMKAYCGEYFPNPKNLLRMLEKDGYKSIFQINKV